MFVTTISQHIVEIYINILRLFLIMVIEIGKPSDFENTKKMIELFPNLGNGYGNELPLRELAKKIRNHLEKPFFGQYSNETVAKYVRFALVGVSFRGKELEGRLGEDKYKKIYGDKVREGPGLKKIKEVNGYDNWSKEEEEFVLKWYNKGKGPKQIFIQYSNMDGFNSRTYDAISSFLDAKRKEGIVGKQRIDWDGDVGFFAQALIERYGKDTDFCLKNSQTLNNYFFEGNQVITTSKLNNFYRREERKLEKLLVHQVDLAA